MLFNSPEFIFFFLPLALAGFFVLGRFGGFRVAIAYLLATSLVFYAWWRPADVPVLLVSVVLNFWLARAIQKTPTDRRAGIMMVIGVVANLAALGWYKYVGLLTHTLNDLFGMAWAVQSPALPLGISFFTFLQIAYLVDVRRERRAEPDLVRYGLFVAFFPHLIAGPILHHKEMLPQFTAQKARAPRSEDLAIGLTLFSFGLFKKLVLADNIGIRADGVFAYASAMPPSATEAWLGAIAYAFQIYFDFSGYSDMAIGLARMFGIRLPVNFDSPYKAKNIIEFWRCWHMTLSRFLRDYLYIPLGGSRVRPARRYINIMITMILGGLWHGASWTLAAWGGLHGLYLVANHLWNRIRPLKQSASWPRVSSTVLTFIFVVIAWVPFRATDFAATRNMWEAMSGHNGIALPRSIQPTPGTFLEMATTRLGFHFDGMFASQAFGDVPSGLVLLALLGLVVFALPNTQELLRSVDPALDWRPRRHQVAISWKPSLRWAALAGCAFGLSVMALSHPVKFI